MDQAKIGRFIAECRKKANLTQAQLAERLGITDRAVSKWETGRAMPDSSIMLELCGVLGISVNDLLSGEAVEMNNYSKEMENNLLDMIRQKEQADKNLLTTEVFLGITVSVVFFAMVLIAAFARIDDGLRILLIAIGAVPFIAGCACALRIEQVAGYYRCAGCGHRYIPTYKSVLFARHMGRTRYMRCPECGRRSWQKKVLSREEGGR